MLLIGRHRKLFCVGSPLVAIVWTLYVFRDAFRPPTTLRDVIYENIPHSVAHQPHEALDTVLSREYIAQLEEIRLELVNKNFSVDVTPRRVAVIRAIDPHYFQLLRDCHPRVRTIFFNERFSAVVPHLAKTYYAGVMSDCEVYKQYEPKNTAKCLSRPDDVEIRLPMSNVLQKYAIFVNSSTTFDLPLRGSFTHMHIITGAVVTPDGDVIKDNFKVIPNRCQVIGRNAFHYFDPKKNSYARHHEILTIAQFWGFGFFHFVVEDLPRIAPYLPFLKRHPGVRVHVQQINGFTVTFLAQLGIDRSRLVSGHVQADVLYMPEGTPCGRGHFFNMQLVSMRLRAGLADPAPPRDTVVLIRRSTKRWFDHHDDILAMILRHATPVGLKTVVYGDRPVRGFDESRLLFSRAYMVVAPHGAGESNLLFSQPGTILVEGMYYLNGKANWCYQHLMRVLGHRYYGLLLRKQCMATTASDVEPIVKYAVGKFKTTT